MTQKRRKADSGKVIGETTALRWEPTHVTKPNPRVVPLHLGNLVEFISASVPTDPQSLRYPVLTSFSSGLYHSTT